MTFFGFCRRLVRHLVPPQVTRDRAAQRVQRTRGAAWRATQLKASRRDRRLLGTIRTMQPLEPRVALDADSVLATGDRYLTLSFAPDGVDIGGQANSLASTFAAFDAQAWQTTVLRAFAAAATPTSLDLGQVSESGAFAFGTPGPATGDLRFGDIRVGARPLAADVKAISISQASAVSGSWAADVIFNSQATFNSLEDLYSVALHEAGHVFGLSHSDDPASPMHVHGVSSATDWTTADIAQLVQAQGQRRPDPWEGTTGNETSALASKLEFSEIAEGGDGSGPAIAYANLDHAGDVDWYRFTPSAESSGPLTIRLWTAGVSLLQPDLLVTDKDGTVLFHQTADGPSFGDLAFHVDHANSDTSYRVRVSSSAAAFDIGGYTLSVVQDAQVQLDPTQLAEIAHTRLRSVSADELHVLLSPEIQLMDDDGGTNDDFDRPTDLQSSDDFDPSTRYIHTGSLSGQADRDFYRFLTPPSGADYHGVMQIEVNSLENGNLIPQIVAYNDEGVAVPVEVLANGNGRLVVQLVGVGGDKQVSVEVHSQAVAPFDRGNYQLTVHFPTSALTLQSYAAGVIPAGAARQIHQLQVATPQLVHWLLTTQTTRTDSVAAVLLRVFNDNGQVVYQVAARPGEQRSAGSVLLNPGTYTVEVLRLQLPGSAASNDLTYAVTGAVVSDPFAIDPANPSDVDFRCPNVPGMFCYPGGIMTDNPYLWVLFIDSLTNLPPVTGSNLYTALMADWWSWYWNQAGSLGPPLALPDQYATDLQGTLTVSAAAGLLANDVDPQQEPLVAAILTLPSHGSLQAQPDGSFTYLGNGGYQGIDSFTYLAIDFLSQSEPVTVTLNVHSSRPLVGDFNSDGQLTVDDIDLLSAALRTNSGTEFDLTGDAIVDASDWLTMITDVMGTTFGDANLDGIFDSADLVLVFQAGTYETSTNDPHSWSVGDWNADGQFDTLDLVAAFQAGGYDGKKPALAL